MAAVEESPPSSLSSSSPSSSEALVVPVVVGEVAVVGKLGELGELGELGAVADVGFAVGFAVGYSVGFASNEVTDETVASLSPRSDITVEVNEAFCRDDAMDALHDDVSLCPTSESDADIEKLTLHVDANRERRSSRGRPS
jgi:hypothetical protein